MAVKHFEHRWRWDYLNMRGIIEMVPVSWLEEYSLPNPTYKTTDTHGNPATLKDLKNHIMEEGLQHAGVIEVSRETLGARIAAGNNRLKVCEELGVSYFPFFVIIVDKFSSSDSDFEVNKPENLDNILVLKTRGDVVVAPSKVFKDLEGRTFLRK